MYNADVIYDSLRTYVNKGIPSSPATKCHVCRFGDENDVATVFINILHEDNIVGSAMLTITRIGSNVNSLTTQPTIHVASLSFMHVDKDHRRKGIASRLLSVAYELSRVVGATNLQLEVKTTNAPAICLYIKSGFKFIGRTSDDNHLMGIPIKEDYLKFT